MSILIVDDSRDSLLLLEKILKSEGYKDILRAASAKEVFHLLQMDDPSNANVQIDLILLDILMPEIDGIAVCHRIKECNIYRDIPIIMVTAVTDVKDLQKAFAAGAIDYITKPFNKVELLTRIRSVLKLKYETDRRKAREKELSELTHQLETANKMLVQLSYKDSLTDLANRRYFDELIEKEWRRAIRNTTPLSLILIDIDHFKTFNDRYGHQTGDNCLRRIAKALSNSVKRSGDIIARYGGEEFITVLPETDIKGAVYIAEKMRSNVIDLGIAHDGHKSADVVSISLGVATIIPDRNSSPDALIAKADRALYKAKRGGRNRISAE